MRIPAKFQYKGHTWKVVQTKDLQHEDGTKCDGICDTDIRTIYIEKALSSKSKTSAFIHELFHAMVHETHVPADAPFTESMEDILAEAFADMLETILKVNWRR